MKTQTLAALLGTTLLALGFHNCTMTTGAGIAASSPPAVEDLYDSPVAAFDRACSRCHGPQGSMFGGALAKLDDSSLEHSVRDMMSGPGQMMPTETEVAAMLGYHQALRAKLPFATINNAASYLDGSDAELKGDVVPGTEVTIEKDGKSYKAAVSGFRWTLAETLQPPFNIVAAKSGTSSRFTFPDRQWTTME